MREATALQAAYLVAGSLLLAFGSIAPPPPRLDGLEAAAAGLATAALLYLVLALGRAAPPRRLLVPAVAAGASEEAVWRWGLLAGTAPYLGWVGALALSTVGFAFRHTRRDGLPAYLLLGAAFGGVFVATGQLAAAVTAHAGYNALVLIGGRR